MNLLNALCHMLVLFLTGMKVYVTGEKELIMEPSIKWAGNPNVTIAVKAFGLTATIQVTFVSWCVCVYKRIDDVALW